MQNNWKRLWVVASLTAAAFVLGGARSSARADDRKINACGCYQSTAGACTCTRPSKCGCPGECEPKGCEEKRQKELDKEIQAETKKAEEADKKRREEEAAKAKAAEQAADDSEGEDTTAADETTPAGPKDKVKKTKSKKEDKKKEDKKAAKKEPKEESKEESK